MQYSVLRDLCSNFLVSKAGVQHVIHEALIKLHHDISIVGPPPPLSEGGGGGGGGGGFQKVAKGGIRDFSQKKGIQLKRSGCLFLCVLSTKLTRSVERGLIPAFCLIPHLSTLHPFEVLRMP